MARDAKLYRGANDYVSRYAKHKEKAENNHDREVTKFISDIQKLAIEAQKQLPNTSVAIRGAQSNIGNFSPRE